MATETVVFKVTGKRPLIQNNPASMGGGQGEKKVGRKTIPTPEVEAAGKVYRLPSGQLYIKSEAFRGALIKAASGLRVGKTPAKMILAAGVLFPEEFCPLYSPDKKAKPITDYAIYTCRAVVQRQGVLRSRPRIEAWACDVVVEIDLDIVTPDLLLDFFKRAGTHIGVGDQRPGAPMTPGPFGTFTVSLAD